MVRQYLTLARTLLEEVERNLQLVQEGQLLYYKQILMYTLYALGYIADALIYSKLKVRPSGHLDRLHYLAQMKRDDIRDLYQQLIVMVFSKLETVSSLRKQDLTNIVSNVKTLLEKVEKELSNV